MRAIGLRSALFCLAVLCAAAPALRAAAVDDLPPIGDRCVIDAAHVLSAAQERQILDVCKQLDRAGVAQLAVATVSSTGDRSRSELAVDLFKKWGLGHGKKRSDGLLVLLAPGNSGKGLGIKVEVGYGLEGVLPDGKVGALLDQNAVGLLHSGQPGAAAVATVQALAGVISSDAAAGGDTAPTDESRADGRRSARGRAAAEQGGSGLAGLALAMTCMVALLISLATAASRRSFPGARTGYAAVGLSGLSFVGLLFLGGVAGWITLLLGLVVNAVTYFSIRSHKCPKDGSWMTIDEEVIEHPTYFSSGTAEVYERCTNPRCGYERTYEKVLPRKQVTVVTGGGGGGGGGFGGGGSDDSFSGGGGESGGGGAERD